MGTDKPGTAGGGLQHDRSSAAPVTGATSSLAPARPETASLRDYLDMIWRRKWVMLLTVVIATISAFCISYAQPKTYQANADLIYEASLDISDPLTGQGYVDTTDRTVQLANVDSVIASPDMLQRATAEMQAQGVSAAAFRVSAAPLTSTTTTTTTTNVVRITVLSGQPRLAAAAADAYAVAFVAYRKESAKAQIQRAIDAVNAKMHTYHAAARKSTDYLVLQQRLADLQLLRSTATGNFRILVPATVPESPVSPKPLQSALLGFAVGIFAAIGLAFLLEQIDTRVRNAEDVAVALQLPVLGRIPQIPRTVLAEGAVTALVEPDGHVAEAFRKVRTNLEFLSVDHAVRSVLVTSCMQGEGKSSVVANLAATLAFAGKKVVVLDADLRRPRQHAYFGLSNDKGVSTVASGQDTLLDALIPVDVGGHDGGDVPPDYAAWTTSSDARSRLYVVPAGPIPPNPGEIVSSQRLSAMIDQLALEADVVLVDTPAMLPVGDASAIASKVDGLIFLAGLHVIRKPQLQSAADQLARLPVRMLGIVVRGAGGAERYGYSSRYGYSYSYSHSGNGDRRRGKSRDAGAADHVDEPVPAAAPGSASLAGTVSPADTAESGA